MSDVFEWMSTQERNLICENYNTVCYNCKKNQFYEGFFELKWINNSEQNIENKYCCLGCKPLKFLNIDGEYKCPLVKEGRHIHTLTQIESRIIHSEYLVFVCDICNISYEKNDNQEFYFYDKFCNVGFCMTCFEKSMKDKIVLERGKLELPFQSLSFKNIK